MRAVIVETKGSDAAILSEDGRFSKIKNRNYAIGQEIVLKNNKKFIKFAASAAAVLVLLGTPAWAYMTPYSYVSLDINPSFEFSVNRFDRVLNVKAVNDDGAAAIEKINMDNLKNKKINEAVKNVIVGLKDQGYIIEGKEGGVVVATSSKSQEKTDELATSLMETVQEEVKFNEKNTGITEETEETEGKDKDKQNKEDKEIKEEKTGKPVEGEETAEAEKKEKPEKTEEVKETKEAKEVRETKEVNKEDKEDKEDINVEVIEVSDEDVSEAKEHNVTPGKMNLVRKLEAKSGKTFDEATFNEWLNKSVQEIMEEIKKYEEEKADKKEAKKEKKEQKENTKEEKSNKKSDNFKNKNNKK